MSVGAGSIKRAARTAKTGNKAAVITGAEAEVMEALTGGREEGTEVTEALAGGRQEGTEVTEDSKENAAEVADEEGKVGEATVGRKGKAGKATAGEKENAEGKAASGKRKATEKATSGKKNTAKKSQEVPGKATGQDSGKSGKQKKASAPEAEAVNISVSEVVVPEDTETHEAYEIGQELPVYLL